MAKQGVSINPHSTRAQPTTSRNPSSNLGELVTKPFHVIESSYSTVSPSSAALAVNVFKALDDGRLELVEQRQATFTHKSIQAFVSQADRYERGELDYLELNLSVPGASSGPLEFREVAIVNAPSPFAGTALTAFYKFKTEYRVVAVMGSAKSLKAAAATARPKVAKGDASE